MSIRNEVARKSDVNRTRSQTRLRSSADVLKLIAEVENISLTLAAITGPGPQMRSVRDIQLGVNLSIRVFEPVFTARAVVIWFGDELGALRGLDGSDVVVRKVAERTGSALVLVDAPGAARDADGCAASVIDWVESNRSTVAPGRPVIVAGVGAGALLAAAAACAGRPGCEVTLQVFISPAIEKVDGAAPVETDLGDLLSAERVAEFWQDLPGLKVNVTTEIPAVVITAGRDPLGLGGLMAVEHLRSNGAVVEHHHHVDEMHDFFTLLTLRASETGFQQVVRAVRSVIVTGHLAPVN